MAANSPTRVYCRAQYPSVLSYRAHGVPLAGMIKAVTVTAGADGTDGEVKAYEMKDVMESNIFPHNYQGCP